MVFRPRHADTYGFCDGDFAKGLLLPEVDAVSRLQHQKLKERSGDDLLGLSGHQLAELQWRLARLHELPKGHKMQTNNV